MYLIFKQKIKKVFYKRKLIWLMLEFIQGLIYILEYFYYHKLPYHNNRFSIKELNIELASKCNLRCKFCSLDHDKPKETMSEELFESILEQLISDKRYKNINVINLHNGGEILLHPKRLEMLKILKKYKNIARAKKINFPTINMLSNGMLLHEKLANEIIDIDVIDSLGLSFDGGTPALFELIRENAVWEKFYQNAKTFDKIRKEKNTKVKMHGITCIAAEKDLRNEWMHPQFKEIINILDHHEIRRFHNWAGEVITIGLNKKPHKIGCSMLMRQMVILPSGNVTVCCNDLNSKAVVGNITGVDLYSIYKSQSRKKYLDKLLLKKKNELDLCRDCETF